jgi:hypothetical protein
MDLREQYIKEKNYSYLNNNVLNEYALWLENKLTETNQALQLLQPDVMLSLPDIRNKLSPIKNLIAILENGLVKGNVEMHDLVLKEIEQCKKSIAYLSGNGI